MQSYIFHSDEQTEDDLAAWAQAAKNDARDDLTSPCVRTMFL